MEAWCFPTRHKDKQTKYNHNWFISLYHILVFIFSIFLHVFILFSLHHTAKSSPHRQLDFLFAIGVLDEVSHDLKGFECFLACWDNLVGWQQEAIITLIPKLYCIGIFNAAHTLSPIVWASSCRICINKTESAVWYNYKLNINGDG